MQIAKEAGRALKHQQTHSMLILTLLIMIIILYYYLYYYRYTLHKMSKYKQKRIKQNIVRKSYKWESKIQAEGANAKQNCRIGKNKDILFNTELV